MIPRHVLQKLISKLIQIKAELKLYPPKGNADDMQDIFEILVQLEDVITKMDWVEEFSLTEGE